MLLTQESSVSGSSSSLAEIFSSFNPVKLRLHLSHVITAALVVASNTMLRKLAVLCTSTKKSRPISSIPKGKAPSSKFRSLIGMSEGYQQRGVETSLDAARTSACATLLGRGFIIRQRADFGDELVKRLGALVAVFAVADGDCAGFGFAVAYYQHVGHFLQLGFADF